MARVYTKIYRRINKICKAETGLQTPDYRLLIPSPHIRKKWGGENIYPSV